METEEENKTLFEKVDRIPSANMTQEDIEVMAKIDNMEVGEVVRTDMPIEKLRAATRKLKPKTFRLYKRADGIYLIRTREPIKNEED